MNTTDDGEGVGEPASDQAPHSHREPGPAVIRFPTEPRFGQALRENPREPMLVGFAVVAALAFGSRVVTSDGAVLYRALGVVVAGLGLLLLASYILRFHQAVLDDDRWTRSRSRRAARAVLRYFYGIVAGVALLALLTWVLIWIVRRI